MKTLLESLKKKYKNNINMCEKEQEEAFALSTVCRLSVFVTHKQMDVGPHKRLLMIPAVDGHVGI